MDEAAQLCDARFEALCTEPGGQELVSLTDNIIPTLVLPLPSYNEAWETGITALPPAGACSGPASLHGDSDFSAVRAGTNDILEQNELTGPMTLRIPAQSVDRRLDRQDHPLVCTLRCHLLSVSLFCGCHSLYFTFLA
jgi:hypothetical protein